MIYFFSVLSLPTFRQLLEVPLANDGADIERVQRTVQFSTGGLGTYFSNQNQVGEFGYFLLTNLFNYEPSNFTYLINQVTYLFDQTKYLGTKVFD